MTSSDCVHHAALIVASEAWWKPIIGYIVTNCAKFSGINFTNDEHDCFLAFRKLFTELFDCFVCKKIGVKAATLESALLEGGDMRNKEAMAILDMLRGYSDFLFFRQEMISMGEKVQEETSTRLIELHRRMAETNTEEATNVAAILEEGEEAILERETGRACADMIAKLQLRSSEVAQFVGSCNSGLTPRRPTRPDGKKSSPPTLVCHKSAILKPHAVKK
jgi:hypothetical protein